MKTILYMLIASIAFATPALGQGITVDELRAKAKAIKANKEVIVDYDKFTDKGRVTTKPYNLVGSWEGAMSIVASGGLSGPPGTGLLVMASLGLIFEGQKLNATPDEFMLLFDTTSPEWLYLKGDRNIYILYDDQRLELEPIGRDGTVNRRSGVSEQIAYTIKRSQVESIAASKKVEMRIGTQTKSRVFKDEMLKRWQKMLDVTKL
jgi:hypothetical protein